MLYDLIVVGAEPSGLAVAADAIKAGLSRVLVLAREKIPVTLDHAARLGLEVRLDIGDVEVDEGPGGNLVVESAVHSFITRACVLVEHPPQMGAPAYPVPGSLLDRVHYDEIAFDPKGQDVLLVGGQERAVILLLELVAGGARPVLVFKSRLDSISWLSREILLSLEYDRKATILWNSEPDSLEDVGGYPMAYFSDRRTPDLQFDHVVYTLPEVDDERPAEDPRELPRGVVVIGERRPDGSVVGVEEALTRLSELFEDLTPPAVLHQATDLTPAEIERLRLENYNATITHFDRAHNELWVLRVEPDAHDVSYVPGQYATLGLGYWEPRVDDADEKLTDKKARRLIRRSYSISSRMLDERGYLIDPHTEREIEFYIVHVKPTDGLIPALTPRLAAKTVGDRVYIGPKIAGRYTLAPVEDPGCDVVFIATGTGEAPHNAMIADLLRRGHHGAILSTVTVRYDEDLAYRETYEKLCSRFRNVKYIPIVTRREGQPKRYVQDLIESGELAAELPHGLDPTHTHVFLCGNPAMIGRPEWIDGQPKFPEIVGVCELLYKRDFTLDRRGVVGNVHYEEYW